MSSKTKTVSKRQEMREQRRKRQQQQRLIVIAAVAVIVIGVALLIIVPQVRASMAPVGSITQVTPYPRPNAQGSAAGDSNAPVKIDLFEDFQCPACRTYTEDAERQVIDTYVKTGKVYYDFHYYPFIDVNSVTKESHQAANAAACAADQGRFWDYHDMLFANWNGENQGAFTNKRLVAFAQTLGLDMGKFNTCFNANAHKAEIDKDFALGQSMGVTGTPSIFVDGKEVRPGYIPSFQDMQQAIDAALAAKGVK